jgi:hypothetical protein
MYHNDLLLTKAMLSACCQEAQRLGQPTWLLAQSQHHSRPSPVLKRWGLVRQVGRQLVRIGTRLEKHGTAHYDLVSRSLEA